MLVAIALLTSSAAAADGQCGADPSAPTCTPKDETCCMDAPGCTGVCSECCLKQVDSCVAPRGRFQTSTCCPKWTVACTVGSVGCCDPARPWQDYASGASAAEPISIAASALPQGARRKPNRLRRDGRLAAVEDDDDDDNDFDLAGVSAAAKTSSNATAYALFTRALLPGLVAFEFDTGSGRVKRKRSVSGPFATYYSGFYGEGTRVFPWDPVTATFYFADVVVGEEQTSVFSIDPTTGASTKAVVSGCAAGGYPYGIAWDASLKALVLATQTATTASYCAVDPASGKGKPVGSVARGAHEGNASDYYAAYLSHVEDGVAVRVGHRLVTEGGELGKATVKLGGGQLKSSWEAIDLGTHGLPSTVRNHPDGGFLSLAPRAGGGSKPHLDIVGWGAERDTERGVLRGPRVLASLENASPPYAPEEGTLGYVGDALSGDRYATMTVARHFVPGIPTVGDKWTVSTLELSTGKLVEAALSPQPSKLGAETTALSGFGLAAAA